GVRAGTYALGVMRLNGGCRTTAVACGSVVDAAITEPVEVDAYSVNAAAGDVYLLRRARTDGAMRIAMEVYDPQGNLVPPAPSSDASRYGFTASAPGAYTVLVSDDSRYDGALTGSYSVSLARLNRPCNARPLSCGSVVDGAVDGPMRSTAYSVSAQAGDVHLLRLLRGRTANGFRPRVEVYDPQGNQVQVASGDVARATFAAAVEGEYTILAGDGLDGTRTGTFSLALARLNRPCSATPLGCGTPARGNIDAPLQTGVYSYTAQAGESFTVRMLGATGDLQEALEVYDPKGNPAGVRVPGNAPGVDVPKPEPGVYTILAMNSSRAGGGAYLVQAFRTRGACAASAGQGATLTGVITGPAPFSALSMATAAGDSLLLRSASLTPGFNAAMDLYDADGIRVDSGTYMLSAQARAAGGYTVIFGGSDPRSTGRYAFSWQALNRPAGAVPLGCGQTVSGTLSPGGQFRWYRAGAADGDLLKLLLTPVSGGFRPQVELYDPGGKRLAGSGGEINRKAAGAGDYLILVSPSTAAGETGAFALALQEPNSACASLPLACGQTLLRAVDAAGQVDAFRFDASAGERIALRVPPRFGSFSPLLELYDPAGNLLQSGPVSQLTRTLTTAGPHMLLVRDRIGTNTGTYRVSLQHEPDACPVDDQEAPAVRLERPTGGEVAAGGTSFRISWQSDDNVDVTGHELRLSTDGCGTFPTLLAAGLGGATQSYDWQVPANVTPTRAGCIRVIATDAAGNSTSADSGPFALIGSGFEPNSTVTYEYDGANRLSRALYPDGTVVWYQYDSAGNLVQTVVTRPPAREAEGNGP
ncbi:MAG: hypothetical protein M1541_11315, partial [Acidobacteria bacterium]|nr:hypothetical protein [Acidobacteriota bacterium]